MARLLMRALSRRGHEVGLASRFRSWEGQGDLVRQKRLHALGQQLRLRLLRQYRNSAIPTPDVWFTYHLYHKAPDWLGPSISCALDIPYVVAEASHAAKQAIGPWAQGYEASVAAVKQASAIITLNRADWPGIAPLVNPKTKRITLKPFHDIVSPAPPSSRTKSRSRLVRELQIAPSTVWLLTVGMMRSGAKLASFELLAAAMRRIKFPNWQLIVVGDGVCRNAVEQAFRDFKGKVFFAGLRSAEELRVFYSAADLFLWPAINEAYGMAILEAQTAGLPVIAGNEGGVPDIVRDSLTGRLVPAGKIAPFAEATEHLLEDLNRCREMGSQAKRVMKREHSLESASNVIGSLLEQMVNP